MSVRKGKLIMEILYGTGNLAKLKHMRERLAPLGIELIGLADMDGEPPKVSEDGETPLENARQKAFAYYEAYKRPVFSCDSGLYFDGVPKEVQPGVHVRTIDGKYLTDEEMRAYYAGLAKKYGDLKAYYKNAICLVMDHGHVYERMDEGTSSKPFLLTAVPHSKIRDKGFPLDSLSKDIKTGKYFYDMREEQLNHGIVRDGFVEFFQEVLRPQNTPHFKGAVSDGNET